MQLGLTRLGPRKFRGIVLILLPIAGLALTLWLATHPSKQKSPAAREERIESAIKALPATPGDIERHGMEATSILPADLARRKNALVPFAPGPPLAARPFFIIRSAQDFAKARECLATAALYEAGGDDVGQAAVIQVILNRVRHPAFPDTICGVVYQGSARLTGCQFSFTCDGSLARTIPERFWERARSNAERALRGWVDKSVGLATHYHTDWVYPYWSPSLVKLSRVGTHLFFGWPGWWGSRSAFTRRYHGGENIPVPFALAAPLAAESPVPEAIAIFDGALPSAGAMRDDAPPPPGFNPAGLEGARLRIVHPDGGAFGLVAASHNSAQQLISVALRLCAGADYCRVDVWNELADVPMGFPIPPKARDRLTFEYVHDPKNGADRLLFDCASYPRHDKAQCR